MRSEKQPNGGFFVSEKSQAQKGADSRQRKKAKIARHVQALKDSEHNNGVLREVLVAQSNEILEKQIVVKDQSSQITQLKNVCEPSSQTKVNWLGFALCFVDWNVTTVLDRRSTFAR